MKVLLLSAYSAQSHAHWQQCLQDMFTAWEWQVLSLPPRHFSWRVRGNPLYWSIAERNVLEREYDLLVATSMVDLATLRGLVPSLGRLPCILYFHENQFDYPRHRQRYSPLEAQMVSIYSALAADRILFNSAFNRDSFMAGCKALLGKMPDRVPPGIVPALLEKSGVLPVPLDIYDDDVEPPSWPGTPGKVPRQPLRLVWVGRFEHDKGGERLYLILSQLERSGTEYELAVTGQQFRNSPDVFREIETKYSHRLVQFGYMTSTQAYRALLRAADVVLSTALHEFQGLAVMEAVASGCLPAVPDRQAYSEIYARPYRYDSHLHDPDLEAVAAGSLIQRLAQQVDQGIAQPPDLSAFSKTGLASRYRDEFQAVVHMRSDSQ